VPKKDSYGSIDRKSELYSDFLTDLNPHPEMGDVVRFTNENAVKRSIRNLILTNRYERPFQPEIGSDINKILFEPMNTAVADVLRQYIKETIENYEPRCRLIDVLVVGYEERNVYVVTIIFATINKEEPTRLELSLYRVR
jgi:phage baseplate assembly protein W